MIPPFASDPFSLTALEAFAQQIGGSSRPSALKYQFNDFYASWKQDSSYIHQPEVLDSLYSWSEYCPYTHGDVVYQARAALLQALDTIMPLSLCEISFNGGMHKTQGTWEASTTQTKNWQVFPNPVSQGEWLNLRHNEGSEAMRIVISDLSGRLIYQLEADKLYDGFSFPDLGSGIYLLHITDSNGQIEIHRLWIH